MSSIHTKRKCHTVETFYLLATEKLKILYLTVIVKTKISRRLNMICSTFELSSFQRIILYFFFPMERTYFRCTFLSSRFFNSNFHVFYIFQRNLILYILLYILLRNSQKINYSLQKYCLLTKMNHNFLHQKQEFLTNIYSMCM